MAPQVCTMLCLGAEERVVGKVGDFTGSGTLRTFVSSPQYLPSPLSPSVIISMLIRTNQLVELVWDFFLLYVKHHQWKRGLPSYMLV